jgi:hypothetical protein
VELAFNRLCLRLPNGYSAAPARQTTQWNRIMNAPMEMDTLAVKRVRLEVLRREHRDLDDAIHALEISGRGDQLTLRRLKKQKLALKDRISRLEDEVTPDIIA